MPSTIQPSTSDLDALLDLLDRADSAVRALYAQLADNPDLASDYEAGLRELHRKRAELAHQVGLASLRGWRESRASRLEGSDASEQARPLPVDPPATTLADSSSVEPEAPPPVQGVPVSEPSVEIPAPVSARQLEEFRAAFAAPASTPRVTAAMSDRTLLLALADHVNIAPNVPMVEGFRCEVEQLERAVAKERQKRWREMSREAQVRWLSILLAWTKALDQDAIRRQEPTIHLAAVFRELRTFSMQDNPGFVHGFARNATPRTATWREDAVQLFHEIRPEPAPAEPKPKATTKAKATPEEENEEPEALAEWPYLDRVKGLRVVLLGGEVNEVRRVALEEAFHFESLDWIPRNRPRMVASLAERAAQGTVDFILVTKFVAHKETEAIERSTRIPILTMRHGYGVTTVRQVLEEHFERADDKASVRSVYGSSG
jgi:hypothetical protein